MATTAPEKSKKKAKKTKPPQEAGTLTSHIILDRSGSMALNWQSTIAGVNAYVENLAKDGIKGTVSLTVFDSSEWWPQAHGAGGTLPHWATAHTHSRTNRTCVETIRTNIEIDDWTSVSPTEVMPRGSTPLRDAVGQTLAKMRESAIEGKVAVVVMTDGLENASTEYSADAVGALIKQCEADGWLITYLGANHDAWKQAKDLGFRRGAVADYAEAAVAATYSTISGAHTHYVRSTAPASTVSFSDSDRKRMVGK